MRCPPRNLRAEAAKELLLPLTLQEGAKVFLLPLTPQEAARALQVAAREPGAAKEVAEEVVVVESEGVGVAGETSRCSNKATSPKPCRASYKR